MFSGKAEVLREATASGTIHLKPETVKRIQEGKIAKGDPLYTAKIAAILGCQKNKRINPTMPPFTRSLTWKFTPKYSTKQPLKFQQP